LVVGQTPPPYGGQAIMVRHLLDVDLAPHELCLVRLNFSLEMEELGRITPRKIGKLVSTIAAIAAKRVSTKSEALLYIPAGPDLNPLLRDIAILSCVRWMFRWTFFHFHAGGVMEYVATLNRLLRTLALFAYRRPDLTIRTSATAPADGARCGSRRDVVVPNCAVDLGPVPERTRRARLRILYVGVLKQDKGILVLLESMRLLREQGHDLELYLVGDSVPRQFRETVEATIRDYGLAGRVTLTGVLVGEAKRQVFRNADIFCFPTFFASETFGLVVVEAMSAGMPVVATDWRGLPTIVDDGRDGFLVPTRDPMALADKLSRLLQDPGLRARMGAAARRKYESMFTPEAFALRMRSQLDDFAATCDSMASAGTRTAHGRERV
jgi:glycosyltransferase involved in cell wall biosynthesis